MTHLHFRRAWVLLLVILLTVCVVGAFAQQAATGKPDKAKAPLSAIDHGDQQVGVDAKGKLRAPTPEEAQALANDLAAKLDKPFDESQVVRMPDGAVAVFAGDSNMNFILIKTNADGTISTRCVDNMRQVREFLGLAKAQPKRSEPERDANGLEVK